MDYGGNPSYIDSSGNEISCGYAPIVAIYADHADWNAPGWYGGPLVVDASMDSPLECQARCFYNAECEYFSCTSPALESVLRSSNSAMRVHR